MTGPITRHRDVESLKTAARWPGADRNTTVVLAARLAAARADRRNRGRGDQPRHAPVRYPRLHQPDGAAVLHWLLNKASGPELALISLRRLAPE